MSRIRSAMVEAACAIHINRKPRSLRPFVTAAACLLIGWLLYWSL